MDLNKTFDTLVVGGGIIGLTVARRLALDGLKVTLLERGACGREASWAGAGVLAPRNPHRKDAISALTTWSLERYPQFVATLLGETGVDPEYDRCGELELLFTDEAVATARADERAGQRVIAPDGTNAYRLLSPVDAVALEPAIARDVLGALECKVTAQVRNPRLLAALKASCTRLGVTLHEGQAVRELLQTGERVSGVRTDGGEVRAAWTVLCAGAWSSTLSPRLTRIMPVHPVRGQMVLLQLDAPSFRQIVSRGKTYLVPRRDGHVLLGATEEHDSGFEKRNTPVGLSDLIGKGLQLAPGLGTARVAATWSGLRPGTPDERPYLGPIPGMDGLIAATGHFRSGLTLAPATAEVVAALISERDFEIDLSICRPGRS